jgi:HEAT repeat protein
MAAIWALGVLGDAEARPAIARLANADAAEERAFAAEAMARLGERSS